MRNGHILSALAAMSLIGSAVDISDVIEINPEPTRGKRSIHSASPHIKTGRDYPHSSTRQRARYARQIAAGQLKF